MTLVPIYRGLTTLLGPVVDLYLSRRVARGKEDPLRIGERMGRTKRPRRPGPLIWIHAASIGEAVSTLALIDRIAAERPSLNMLVTTGTVTSAHLLETRLPTGFAWHQYVPIDRLAYVRRFLDHWRPDLALWVESELWPNLITESHRRGIPLILLNARMSQGSFRRWQRLPALARPILGAFDLCLAQDELQAQKFEALGASRVLSVGDLKLAAAPLPLDQPALDRLTAEIGDRPHWLAASTHAGEEAVVAKAHRTLERSFPDLLTVIAPRHPARGPEIAEMLASKGLSVARRSLGERIDRACDVYLADTLGELGTFYRLCGIAFIGGSLGSNGGHNPVEAAILECAILHGPNMANAAAVAGALARAGATETVRDAAGLAAAVGRLLAEPELRRRRTALASAVADRDRAVLDRILEHLGPWLDRIESDVALRA
ncbi:MAG TPA: 3-deoxy-D-manno-octulosonic acid transferase [Stellaceae bacterium]|nr:3-deoxy-D-manno-octulosonic acid transferase [Stellaceae bacterium]